MDVQDRRDERLQVQQHPDSREEHYREVHAALAEVVICEENVGQDPQTDEHSSRDYYRHRKLHFRCRVSLVPTSMVRYHDDGACGTYGQGRDGQPANHDVEEVLVSRGAARAGNIEGCHCCCKDPRCCYGDVIGRSLPRGFKARQTQAKPKRLE